MARRPKAVPVAASGPVTVECIVPNVHLGDGRELAKGERAEVSLSLAEALLEKKQVIRG